VAMYGCAGQLVSMGDLLFEGNMFATNSLPQSDVQRPSQLGTFARHPKDLIPPWVSSKRLAQVCHESVKKIDHHL
jgi:hypothetical protein